MNKYGIMIKNDNNFFHHPMWFIQKNDKLPFTWIDKDDYEYSSPKGIPNEFDMMILYAILAISQSDDYKKKLDITAYELLNIAGFPVDKFYYDRLKYSLTLWTHVSITFQKFYNKRQYCKKEFHIIDQYILKPKELHIKINELWIEHIKESNYYSMIDFDYYKALPDAISMRLYEILLPFFSLKREFKISAKKLGRRLGLTPNKVKEDKIKEEEKYIYMASTVINKVIPALNKINKMEDRIKRLKLKNNKKLMKIEYEITGYKNDRIIHFKDNYNPFDDIKFIKECNELGIILYDDAFETVPNPIQEENFKKYYFSKQRLLYNYYKIIEIIEENLPDFSVYRLHEIISLNPFLIGLTYEDFMNLYNKKCNFNPNYVYAFLMNYSYQLDLILEYGLSAAIHEEKSKYESYFDSSRKDLKKEEEEKEEKKRDFEKFGNDYETTL